MSHAAIVIDDLREFDFPARYIRTLPEALAALERGLACAELWLDHDLGGDDTIRPFVDRLEELTVTEGRSLIGKVVICSANPVGVAYIKAALSRHYDVSVATPQKAGERA